MRKSGFTLIELSIVLVIIGLIVGGILTGADLIKASEIRATISQLEKYNTSINAFRGKYGGLPGDLRAAKATQLGMTARSGAVGHGDGDGLLYPCATINPNLCGCETILAWNDLSSAGMLDHNFSTATDAVCASLTRPQVQSYFPPAKLGRGNYITIINNTAFNFFLITGIYATTVAGVYNNDEMITPNEAANLDAKMDDGLPHSGKTVAVQNMLGNFILAPPAALGFCVFTGATQYNTTTPDHAETPLCTLRVRIN